jgi:hypothetical protein
VGVRPVEEATEIYKQCETCMVFERVVYWQRFINFCGNSLPCCALDTLFADRLMPDRRRVPAVQTA